MVLQTNGNLQRLLSAYFNVPSRVQILKNELVPCSAPDTTDEESSPFSSEAEEEQENGSAKKTRLLNMRFERKILMFFGDKLAYEADSIVAVKEPQTLSLLSKHHFGLGQVFRGEFDKHAMELGPWEQAPILTTCSSHLRKTPQFALHAVGRHGKEPGCSFWRDYSLFAEGVVDCHIRETFVEGLFEPHTPERNPKGTVWHNDYS